MSLSQRRRPIDIWPAFVDAVASLLMVVIFVLLVAAVGQQFLTEALFGRDQALARLNTRVDELADLLSLREAESVSLNEQLAIKSASLAASEQALAVQADLLEQRAAIVADQDRALADGAQRRALLENEIAALIAMRDRIESELQTIVAERDDVRARLSQQSEINLAAQAQLERLNLQLAEVRKQLASLAHTLELSEAEVELKDARITALGEKLNLALASKAAQLERYRSEFFGRLRAALTDVPGIRIVGDRFVLPTELLFASGADQLGADGRQPVAQVAATLKEVLGHVPDDLDWVLRIDGHTDRRPIHTERFASNWELSAARAISIVHELVRLGIPAERLAATGFAEYHPIDNGDSDAAFARNRRIEIKLTSR